LFALFNRRLSNLLKDESFYDGFYTVHIFLSFQNAFLFHSLYAFQIRILGIS